MTEFEHLIVAGWALMSLVVWSLSVRRLLEE